MDSIPLSYCLQAVVHGLLSLFWIVMVTRDLTESTIWHSLLSQRCPVMTFVSAVCVCTFQLTTQYKNDVKSGAEYNQYLSHIVEWKPGEENITKELGHTEDSVNHPVSQPFGIILLCCTFNGLDPEIKEKSQKRKS